MKAILVAFLAVCSAFLVACGGSKKSEYEGKLVGRWEAPNPHNPQVILGYEFSGDRKFSIQKLNPTATELEWGLIRKPTLGTWRVEGDSLVMQSEDTEARFKIDSAGETVLVLTDGMGKTMTLRR